MKGPDSRQGTDVAIHALLWALPAFLAATYILPFIGVAGWSFTRPELGLDHYWRVFFGSDVTSVMVRTLRICVMSTVITVLIGYVLSYYWVMGAAARRRIIEICIFVPFWISVLVRAFGWIVILREDGLANNLLLALHIVSERLSTGRNEFTVIVGMVHFMVPFAVFPLATVMRRIETNTLLAAFGLGARPAIVFRRIFLPQSLPGIFAALVMVFVFSLGFFVTPTILGGGRVVMVAESVFVQMFQTANWGLGAALSVVLLVIVTTVIWAFHEIVRIERFIS